MLVGLQNSFAVSNCAVTTTLAPAAAGLSALLVKAIDSHVSTGALLSLSLSSMHMLDRALRRPPGWPCLHQESILTYTPLLPFAGSAMLAGPWHWGARLYNTEPRMLQPAGCKRQTNHPY